MRSEPPWKPSLRESPGVATPGLGQKQMTTVEFYHNKNDGAPSGARPSETIAAQSVWHSGSRETVVLSVRDTCSTARRPAVNLFSHSGTNCWSTTVGVHALACQCRKRPLRAYARKQAKAWTPTGWTPTTDPVLLIAKSNARTFFDHPRNRKLRVQTLLLAAGGSRG